jgi:AcrR family transcriptional regulator
MNNSHSQSARLQPRKAPSQPRSAQTVGAILTGAAHILERHGLEGYTTNAIAAKAGVSIGSLYQYFPTKDAVTVALIEREMAQVVDEATQALRLADRHAALQQLIEVAVRHQLRRPALAALLDFEQHRLSAIMPPSGNRMTMRAALVEFLHGDAPEPGPVAEDLMELIRALTDAAGRRSEVDPPQLVNRIGGAVRGYLQSLPR